MRAPMRPYGDVSEELDALPPLSQDVGHESRMQPITSHIMAPTGPRFRITPGPSYYDQETSCVSIQQQSCVASLEADGQSLPLQVQGLGMDGWRRFLLYTLILFLSVIVSVNTALTIWILSLVNASSVCASFSLLSLFSLLFHVILAASSF